LFFGWNGRRYCDRCQRRRRNGCPPLLGRLLSSGLLFSPPRYGRRSTRFTWPTRPSLSRRKHQQSPDSNDATHPKKPATHDPTPNLLTTTSASNEIGLAAYRLAHKVNIAGSRRNAGLRLWCGASWLARTRCLRSCWPNEWLGCLRWIRGVFRGLGGIGAADCYCRD
jgi:hypothetical protein